MTTLPQTTPMRMPRPNGQGGHLAIPAPAPIAVPASGGGTVSGANQLNAGDVWRVMRTNVWLIAGLVAASLVLGYFVNWYLLKYYAHYTAIGYLRVETPHELLASSQEAPPANVELEQRAQAAQLTHEGLWLEVLRDSAEIRKTAWFQQFKGPLEQKEDLEDNFSVTPVTNSRLIRIAMQYRVPENSKTIVSEIVEKHIADQATFTRKNFEDKSAPLKKTAADLEQKLQNLLGRIGHLSKTAGPDGTSMTQIEINRLMEEKVDIESKRGEATHNHAFLQQMLAEGKEPPGLREALNFDVAYISAQRAVAELDAALRAEIESLGPDHPRVNRLRRQKGGYEQTLQDRIEQVKASVVDGLFAEYTSAIAAADQRLKGIGEQLLAADEQLKKISQTRQQLAALEAEADLKREALEKTTNEFNELGAQIDVGTRSSVQWATRPVTPDKPSFPRLPVTLSVAGVLGLLLALGIAFVREITDTSVRSPRDIARVGQINLLGLVPDQDDDPQSAGAPLPLVIFEAPQSAIAEQFRQIRTRLQHAASLDTTRSILVTGASAGDGKTTVACNLAAGLALNGRRILLVDANFRRPELHKVFGTDNGAGLSDVLESIDAFDQCVFETKVPNLSVLTSGPRPANPTELLESQLLTDFVERALEEYDHVIFDSGPLPLVSETIALAPRVDGVVTVVRAKANSRGLVQRVRDTLKQVKAEHLGMILNGVRSQAGGYYGRNILDYYKYQDGTGTGVNGHS